MYILIKWLEAELEIVTLGMGKDNGGGHWYYLQGQRDFINKTLTTLKVYQTELKG